MTSHENIFALQKAESYQRRKNVLVVYELPHTVHSDEHHVSLYIYYKRVPMQAAGVRLVYVIHIIDAACFAFLAIAIT